MTAPPNTLYGTPDDVGRLIRVAREAKNWRQHHLAEAIGVSTQTINRYENSERSISHDKLIAIASALDIPVGQLFVNGDGLTEEDRALLEYLRTHPDHRIVVRSTLRGLQEIDRPEYETE